MGPIETQEVLSEEGSRLAGSQDITVASDNDNMKLVPVTESIRYRKRAQSAEKKVEALTEQLVEAKSQLTTMSEQLSNIQAEQKLTRKLAAAGTVDMETAVLLAKAKMEGQTEADLDGVIEQLKNEKQYLFTPLLSFESKKGSGTVRTKKTAGAKERMTNNQTVLERSAKKAATTGNRTDLQEYLKLRRNFM
ncbi:MAG TPA: hypothetical protein VMW72_16345 [Sedimentisphaerales bacterium]|nr:hypothetical protein [Sedimentisphaerales bacterium]